MARPTDDPKTARLEIRATPALLAAVDEWRQGCEVVPPRAEAVRYLIELGLAAATRRRQEADGDEP